MVTLFRLNCKNRVPSEVEDACSTATPAGVQVPNVGELSRINLIEAGHFSLANGMTASSASLLGFLQNYTLITQIAGLIKKFGFFPPLRNCWRPSRPIEVLHVDPFCDIICNFLQ
jgi:hypothetical protein